MERLYCCCKANRIRCITTFLQIDDAPTLRGVRRLLIDKDDLLPECGVNSLGSSYSGFGRCQHTSLRGLRHFPCT